MKTAFFCGFCMSVTNYNEFLNSHDILLANFAAKFILENRAKILQALNQILKILITIS